MTTVVLEGDGMDELLARVADEHGGSARVLRAERVRVGGVAGFFARHRYELVVEVDDDEDEDDGEDDGEDTAGDTRAVLPVAGSRPAAEGSVHEEPPGVQVGDTTAEDTGEGPDAPAPEGPGDGSTSTAPGSTASRTHAHQHGPQGRDQEETHVLGHPRGYATTAAEVPGPRATADPTARPDRCEELLGDIFDSPIARALVMGGVLDLDANAPAPGRAARPGALDHLLEAADAADEATPGTGPGVDGVDGVRQGPAGTGRTRGRHAAPAEPLERGRPVSTESAAFAAVLDAVRGAAEPDAPGAPAPAAGTGAGPAGPEVRTGTGPDADRGGPTGQGRRPGEHPEPVAAGTAVAELMALLAARHVGQGGEPGTAAEPPVADPTPPPAPAGAVRAAAPAPAAPAPDAPAPAAPAPDSPAPIAPAPGSAGAGEDAATARARAAAAGLPPALLDRLPVGAGAGDLHELLEELPAAPPLPAGEGDLVAVVGAPREALVVARALATRLGLGPEGVVVAACPTGHGSPRREVVRDAAAARRAAATVRLGDAPGVVVVQVECDPEGVRWARGVVGALRADQVHVVVDATRKSADTERWLDGVFVDDPDAAHVVHAGGSADPGTVLGLELPVASVDGRDGGASAWTALLTRALPEPVAAEPVTARRPRRPRR